MTEATLSPTVVPTAAAIAAQAPPIAQGACVTCGHAGALAYCPACGQQVRRERLTVRGVFAHLVTDAFDLNHGLLFTALELSRRPGQAVREYLAGRTVRFTNPVKYFLVAAALSTFIYIRSGLAARTAAEFVGGLAEGTRGEVAMQPAQVAEFIGTYFNLLMAAALPISAVFSRLLFRRGGFNYAEHLVFNTYVYAQQSLIFVVAGLAFGVTEPLAIAAMTVASLAYYAWAAAGAFQERALSATLRSLAVNALAYAAYMLVLMFAALGAIVALLLRNG
jgi:hypothetical protein